MTFGTQIFELCVDSEIKVYRDTFKKDISFWIYVKIRYENFHCSVIVDNMKEDCVLLEKLRQLQRVAHVLPSCIPASGPMSAAASGPLYSASSAHWRPDISMLAG